MDSRPTQNARVQPGTAEFRSALRHRRRAVDPDDRTSAARRLSDLTLGHCRSIGVTEHTGRIGIYIAADGEIPPDGIAATFREMGWSVWVPVVDSGTTMTFGRIEPEDRLVQNRFGIPEPEHTPECRAATALDVVVVPCVAVDRNGNRLGMGAGFYDRALSRARRPHREERHDGTAGVERPLLIGVVFDFQVVDSIVPDPWDVPMDLVVTDRRVVEPASRRGTARA